MVGVFFLYVAAFMIDEITVDGFGGRSTDEEANQPSLANTSSNCPALSRKIWIPVVALTLACMFCEIANSEKFLSHDFQLMPFDLDSETPER
jgi:hypothetical protein